MLDDRDYMKSKGGSRSQKQGPGLSATAILIIAILIAFFIQLNTNDFGGNGYFRLYVNIRSLAPIWMFIGLVSHIFMHSITNYGHVVWNAFALFIFGRFVEQHLGRGHFIRLFLGSGIISGAIWVLARLWSGHPYTLVGASGAIFGITIAAALLDPDREVLLFMTFPIKLKFLVPAYMIISLLAINDKTGTAHIAHAGGLVGGLILMHIFHRNIIRWTLLPFLTSKSKGRKKSKKSISFNFRKEVEREVDFKVIDQILDKIGKHGMKSLTKKEKRLLEQARKKIGDN